MDQSRMCMTYFQSAATLFLATQSAMHIHYMVFKKLRLASRSHEGRIYMQTDELIGTLVADFGRVREPVCDRC